MTYKSIADERKAVFGDKDVMLVRLMVPGIHIKCIADHGVYCKADSFLMYEIGYLGSDPLCGTCRSIWDKRFKGIHQ